MYVKERRGRELSVRVALAGGVYRRGEQLNVLEERVLKGLCVKLLGG